VSIIEEKANRLLAEGRVRVLEAGHGHPGLALVKGDHGEYEVTVVGERVHCSCPSWRACSHKRAVSLVVGVEA
jgi:hypothetical protein